MITPQRQPGKFSREVMGARPTRKASVCRSGRPLDGLAGRTSDVGPASHSAPDGAVARERARKIASKNRSSTTTGIGGSFQLANSAPPLGVTGSASAPTARMHGPPGERRPSEHLAARRSGRHSLAKQ